MLGVLPWSDWTHRTHKNQRTENDKQRSWVVSLPTPEHVSLALKSRSMLGPTFTTGKGQVQKSRRIIPATPP